jgi:hypothetical protein
VFLRVFLTRMPYVDADLIGFSLLRTRQSSTVDYRMEAHFEFELDRLHTVQGHTQR